MRTDMEIRNVLPHLRSASFVNYVLARSSKGLLDTVDALRLNKLVGGSPGVTGTSLVSRVAVPAVLGAAVEFGSILQQTNGAVTTLRGNLLGVARMVFGDEQFPYCPELDSGNCTAASRRLRRISGSAAYENTRTTAGSGLVQPPGAPPTASGLPGDDFRVVAWGARFDLTPSNNLDDPKFIRAWTGALETLRKDPTATDLSAAVNALFETASNDVYVDWMADTVALLRKAPGEAEFYAVFETRLDLLASRMAETDPEFSTKLNALSRAYANYFDVRDALIRQAQIHKLSLEYTSHRRQDQPSASNLRFIYSHQPTAAPAIITLNAAGTWYDETPTAATATRLRDIQFAAQLDRRIGQVPHFGYAVVTFGAYYQWMREDAVITIAPGNVAPGSGIVLPAKAATLLGTKGHISVVQGKLSIPIAEAMKVPLSVTWASRKELIKEEDVRTQIGLTLDLDVLFR